MDPLETESDYETLGQDLVKFIIENDCVHMSQWYAINKKLSHHQWGALIKNQNFAPYYNQARAIIAIKYIDGTICPSIAHRFLRIYFPEIKDSEDEEVRTKIAYENDSKKNLIEFDLKLKAQVSQLVSEEIRLQYEATMKQITEMQQKQMVVIENKQNDDE